MIAYGIGTASWTFSLERTVIRTRYLITSLLSILAIISVVYPSFNIALTINTFHHVLALTASIFLILKLAKLSQVEFKVITFFFYAYGTLSSFGIAFSFIIT